MGNATKADSDAPRSVAVVDESLPCADDGPCLPITKLCASRAVNYLNFDDGKRPDAPEGCEWVVNETEMPGDEVVLYLAARCGKKTAKLAFAGGAHLSELSYETSALAEGAPSEEPVVKIGGADQGEPKLAILGVAREAFSTPAEAAKCQVRKANVEGWLADAMVVNVSAAESAKAPKDEPRSACGSFGYDGGTMSYWRVFQGYSWFYQLGQDQLEIDSGAFTVMTKDDKGEWGQVAS
ncbi:hypothetical protein V5G24_21725 [Xanthobacter sp. VTT E-85241]|uniref:hypothetical protein n=1 Tax=Roseixanthobacter finlandensis TaxID=3119922 RepID=UPI00372CCEA2